MGKSENPLAENRDKLAELFPGVFSDGRVDCEELKKLTGVELEDSKDRYGLSWAGKANCFKEIERTTTKTLHGDRDASVDFDTTENLFIEGDNLEVLKTLQRSYYGKVKMIYIDPPYNTGHDFIYNDKFARSESEEGAESGTRDKEGNLTRADRLMMNDRSKGRFHSNWLNMMYPRLFLARNLLKSDGVIFVSIGDNEVANLRMIMDEIFGEENLLETFIWESTFRPSNMSQTTRKNCEYILAYTKHKDVAKLDLVERKEDPQGAASLTQNNNKPRELTFPANVVSTSLPEGTYAAGQYGEVKLHDDLQVKGGWIINEFNLTGKFKWSQEYLNEEITAGVQLAIKTESFIPYYKKVYQKTALRPTKLLPQDLVGDVLAANAEIQRIFKEKLFDYPKPTSLVRFLCNIIGISDDEIVLDFFAGSGTTAHAVMAQNAEDGGDRKWICVQLPEKTDEKSEARKAGYETIADISRERIRRAGKKIAAGDVGFKAFKLEDSNFKVWNTDVQTEEQLQGQIKELLESPYAADATEENMLNELILKNGLPLTVSVEKKDGYYVMGGNLAISLADEMTQAIFTTILAEKPTKIILLDTSFRSNDQLKTNLLLQAKDQGVDNVVVI